MRFKLFTVVFLSILVVWAAVAQQPRRVDEAALRDAGKTGDEWITYNMNWSEQRFSPLNQINASNVSRIGVAWSYDIPAATGNPQIVTKEHRFSSMVCSTVLLPGASCTPSTCVPAKSSGIPIPK